MADKEILINTKIDVDYKDAEKQLKKIDDKIKQFEHKRTITFDLQSNLEKQIRELETTLEAEKEKLSSLKIDLKLSKNSVAPSDVERQTKLVSGLQSQYNKLQSSIFRYEDTLDKCNAEIKQLTKEGKKYRSVISDGFAAGASAAKSTAKNTDKAAASQDKLKTSTDKATKSLKKQGEVGSVSIGKTKTNADRVTQSIKALGDRLTGLVKRVFVFGLITTGLRKVRDWFANILKTNVQMQSALANLKGAIYTLVTPLVNTVIPILVKIVNIITTIIYYIEVAITALTGFQFSSIVSDAQALYNAANGTSDSLSDANDNAKELKKTLASFDTLEVLNKDEDTDTLDTGSLSSSSTAPNWSFSKMLTDELDELAFYVADALLLLGVILLFSGASIPLGLGLIAVGALSLAGQIEANWEKIKELVEGSVGTKLDIAGWGEICLGLIMIAAGMTKWGIGLIVAGVTQLALVEAISPGKLKETMTGILQTPIEVSGLVAAAFGILLICCGKTARGLGLLVYGLGVLGLMEHWQPGALKELIQTPLAGKLITIGSYVALAFGIVALCAGKVAAGIALIAMGAAGLYSMERWNPNALKEIVSQPLVGKILTIAGYVAVTLGVIMICAGQILKGIAITVAGLVDLYSASKWNPNAFKEIVSQPLVGKILTIAGYAAVACGLVMICCGHAFKGLVLMATGLADIYTQSKWNGNGLKEMLKGPLGLVLKIAGYVAIAMGLIMICTGHAGVGITLIVAGISDLAFQETALDENSSGFAEVASLVVGGIASAIATKLASAGIKALMKSAFSKLFKSAAEDSASAVADGTATAIKTASKAAGPSAAASAMGTALASAFAVAFVAAATGVITAAGISMAEETDPNVHKSDSEVGRDRQVTAQQDDFWATYAADVTYANTTLVILNGTLKATTDNIEEQQAAVIRFAEKCGYSYDSVSNSLTATVKNAEGAIETITFSLDDLSSTTTANFTAMQDAASAAGKTIPANIALGILTGTVSVEEAAEQLGISVPESVASGISNEDGKQKVDQAIDNIAGAVEEGVDETASTIESKANETWNRIVASSAEAGVKIPEEITKGIEDGTLSVEEACDLLLDYINDGVSVTGTNVEKTVGNTTDAIEKETSETTENVKKQHSDLRKAIQSDAEETEKTYKDTNKNIQTLTTETTDHINKKTKKAKQDIIDGSKEASDSMSTKLGTGSSAVQSVNSALKSIGDTAENELGSNSTLTNAVESGESDSRNTWDSAADWQSFLVDYTNEFEGVFGTTGTVVECARLGWNAVLNMFTLGTMSLKEALSPIKSTIQEAFDFTSDGRINYSISNFFGGIQSTIAYYMNGVISIVESGISSITSGLNSLVTSMNSVVRQAQNIQYKRYTTGSYLYSPYLSRISVPRYAAGTIVPPNSAHLAVIGDNTKEPEVVSPISSMKQAFIEAMQEMGGMNGGNVNVYLDGKQISNAVSKWQGRTNRAYGL